MSISTMQNDSFSDSRSGNNERSWGDIVRQVLVVVALVSTVVVNALANILPINGQTTGELSAQFPVFFTPAGYVFSIWSLIYVGLAAYAIYQALPSKRFDTRLQRIAYPFVLSCIANCAWILVWHYNMVALSLVIMVTLLATLIVIYAQLYPHFAAASIVRRLAVHIPFRIYLGWITVATIVNATVLLYNLNWSGWGLTPTIWFVIISVIGTVIALFFSIGLRDAVYPLVIIWAYVGQFVKHSDTPVVRWTALVMAVVVALSLLVPLLRSRQSTKNTFTTTTTTEDKAIAS